MQLPKYTDVDLSERERERENGRVFFFTREDSLKPSGYQLERDLPLAASRIQTFSTWNIREKDGGEGEGRAIGGLWNRETRGSDQYRTPSARAMSLIHSVAKIHK